MPTAGWMHEGAIERYWEAHPPSWDKVRPTVFPCHICEQEFKCSDELKRHRMYAHPLEKPAILYRGRSLLSETVIREPLYKTELELIACSAIKVREDNSRWREEAATDLKVGLSRSKESTWHIRLENERSEDAFQSRTDYTIKIRIPNQEDLDAIDERFIRELAVDQITHKRLQAFEAALCEETAAREYAASLGNYALGLLIKERRMVSSSSVGFDEFEDKMKSALNVLERFDRPVANSVRDTIRFNLNSFDQGGNDRCSGVRRGLSYFRGIITGSAPKPDFAVAGCLGPICPVDDVTHRLYTLCDQALEGGLKLVDLENLSRLERSGISEYDLIKIHVLCADGYLRLGKHLEAREHLRTLRFHHAFEDWCRRMYAG